MALYLKYRPQSFPDVVGQDHVVTTLEQALETDRASHAYLFCGTRGTGKTSVARILAKAILTRGIKDETLKKHVEKGIEDGSFVDLTEIDAASNRRIDDIRDLIEKVGFAPAAGSAKVYIIDEVHMLTKEAFNALLKTLEEPPPYAYFILATTELHKVPDTIQSRCQRFLFKRVKDDDILSRLQYIADREKIPAEREALRAVAKAANGSFRDGISLLDQLRPLKKITVSDVLERTGSASDSFVDALLSATRECDADRIASLVRDIEAANIPVDTVATHMLHRVREDMHAAIRKNESHEPFVRMMNALLSALKDIRLSPVPGLALEASLLLLCGDAAETPKREAKPAPKKAAPAPASSSAPAEAKQPEPQPAEKKPAVIHAEELTPQTILAHWEAILKALPTPSVRMSLKDATVAVEEGTVVFAFSSAFHRDKVAAPAASRSVEDVLKELFKTPINIRCILEKTDGAKAKGAATDLVEAAAEVFGEL